MHPLHHTAARFPLGFCIFTAEACAGATLAARVTCPSSRPQA